MSKYDLKFTKETEAYTFTINVWADDELENWYGCVDICTNGEEKKDFSFKISEPFVDTGRGREIFKKFLNNEKGVLRLVQKFQ